MKRLTGWDHENAYIQKCFEGRDCEDMYTSKCDCCEHMYATLVRLAAYEDTGLTPEEVADIKKFDMTSTIGDLPVDSDGLRIAVDEIARLQAENEQYRQMERDGRLVVLPAKSVYGNTDIDGAIRRAAHICCVTNNEQSRLTLDALIEKQIREAIQEKVFPKEDQKNKTGIIPSKEKEGEENEKAMLTPFGCRI